MTDASETWNVLGVSRYKRAIAQRPAPRDQLNIVAAERFSSVWALINHNVKIFI
ncbi:hypothetical protein H6F78_10450 [Coleofasciculus sp. FACHB-64]|uniref:hypothetical protein n=1 Tax=Cyanophyceae TaxID=3028117 RepID=UPI001686656D|nr:MULTISPECIES: hypothetical protein [unclassified Coleofasciculus]MBD1840885.1 hypothetical protein [Coleofasciculus sp. FACHB-501]MBD1892113.1 hypothetical protein [Coleofasciculus sp. FACHB-SPT9]MBD2046010.1 hypothetical protein [Coleofasciculus sp. FACHB-64]